MTPWTDAQVGYAAGLLEGEGCFAFHNGQPRVILGMTDEDTVSGIREMLGIGYVLGPYDKGEDRKQVWYWHVSDKKEIATLLLAITPLMSKRRTEKILELAENLIDFFAPKFCEGCGELIESFSRRGKRYCSKRCNALYYSRSVRAAAKTGAS